MLLHRVGPNKALAKNFFPDGVMHGNGSSAPWMFDLARTQSVHGGDVQVQSEKTAWPRAEPKLVLQSKMIDFWTVPKTKDHSPAASVHPGCRHCAAIWLCVFSTSSPPLVSQILFEDPPTIGSDHVWLRSYKVISLHCSPTPCTLNHLSPPFRPAGAPKQETQETVTHV